MKLEHVLLLALLLWASSSDAAPTVSRPNQAAQHQQAVQHAAQHFQHLSDDELSRVRTLVVKFHAAPSADVLADTCKRYHLENPVPRGHTKSLFLVTVAETFEIRTVLHAMKGDPLFEWAHPQLLRTHNKRKETINNCHIRDSFCIDEPIYGGQWHLRTEDIGLDVQDAWALTFAKHGEKVLVAVVDDGLDTRHADWDHRHRANVSYDYNDDDADPTPFTYDAHGTAAAGVAVAGANGVCGLGAAPLASLAGIRLIAKDTTDEQEARGLGMDSRLAPVDIYSASWGPTDDGRRLEGPGPLLTATLHERTLNGRGGKGVIYVWAGGNGRSRGDNCNYDGYANSRFTFTIGARDHNGGQPYYSEDCAALLATAPSSGSDTNYRISTTDLTGRNGDSATDCMASFGGTSAAAPLAAGVYALILSINPNLTWRDLVAITVMTSRLSKPPMDPLQGPSTYTNMGGYTHMHGEGFGLLNVSAMSRMALSWPASSPIIAPPSTPSAFLQPKDGTQYECFFTVDSGEVFVEIPDSGTAGQNRFRLVNFTVEDEDLFVVEAVDLYVWINHPHRGDVAITLHHSALPSPPVLPLDRNTAFVSLLSLPRSDTAANYVGWRFGSYRHWGEPLNGTWSVIVSDERADAIGGSLTRWVLSVSGHHRDGSPCTTDAAAAK